MRFILIVRFGAIPDIATLTAVFINYFIYEISTFICLANAQKPDYFDALEKKKNIQWAIAAAADAQNRPQMNDVDIPILTKRNITGIIGPQIG